jgi:hypothetical protein
MSSNHNSGGRGNGQRGRGGRGHGRNAANANDNSSFQRADASMKKSAVFYLSENPSSATTYSWMEAIVDHGRTKYRNGLHKVCDPDAETAKPVIGHLARPSRRAQVYQDYELERRHILGEENPLVENATADQIAERNLSLNAAAVADTDDQYQTDVDLWKLRAKHIEDRHEEMTKDCLEMFGYMWQHITKPARLALEEKYGKQHFQCEDPKVLADAVREHFIGREVGADGNELAVENARRRYATIKQKFDQPVSTYAMQIVHDFEVLMRQEVISNTTVYPPGTNIREEKMKYFTEKVKVQHFICGLNDTKFKEWKSQLLWSPRLYPMPDTMQEAYRQAVDWEEQYNLQNKNSQNRDDRAGIKQGVFVSREGSGGKKPGYKTTEYDINGEKICWKWRDTKTCDRGKDCPFSHKPAADTKYDPVKDQINKASKEVKFDLASAAGGGPGPKKG